MLNSSIVNNGFRTFINFSDELLFPQFCYQCNEKLVKTELLICIDCLKSLNIIITNNRMKNLKSSTNLDFAYSGYWFDEELQHCLHLLKYQQFTKVIKYLLFPLKNQIVQLIKSNSIDALIPVPLHSVKCRERGFNQAEIIAKVISDFTKTPIIQPIIRKNWTTTQTTLSINQRKQNIKNAFQLIEIPSATGILIIDDVLTTGSTTNECARIIKERSKSIIGVFTISAAK